MKPLLYRDRLTAYDFDGHVALHHMDGSFFYWKGAFFTGEFDDLWAVYTEHNGYHVFNKADVIKIDGDYRPEGWVPFAETKAGRRKMRNYYNSLERCKGAVGTGWHDLVEEAWEICQEEGRDVLQVKEKFGGLRFYYSGDRIKRINDLEMDSLSICERCGNEGSRASISGWLMTLCDSCQEEVEQERRAHS